MEMGVELFTLAGRERDIARLSPKWLDLTTLYHSKGRNKQLRLREFLDLLPALAMIVFTNERTGGSPRRWDTPQEQETAMKNLLLLFDKLYIRAFDVSGFFKLFHHVPFVLAHVVFIAVFLRRIDD